jgi:hypothetical protein
MPWAPCRLGSRFSLHSPLGGSSPHFFLHCEIMITKPPSSRNSMEESALGFFKLTVFANYVLVIAAVCLLTCSLAWNFSTRCYLRGFADAIVPVDGSSQEKSEALLAWLRHEPGRNRAPGDQGILRDPVWIVQNAQLLKVCGSASNAFLNLADAARLNTRRLLLLDSTGGAKHVVVEVQWGKRWVVVDPSLGLVFKDGLGRALSKENLRDPVIFQDAVSRMPGYSRTYTFEHTHQIRLERVPLLGAVLRHVLNRLFPAWEGAIDWAYVLENPSLWPMLASIPLLLSGILIRWFVYRYRQNRIGLEIVGIRKRLRNAGRGFLYRSA